MTWYDYGSTVTLSLTASSGATVALRVVAPNGTATTPTPAFAGGQWSASVTANQYDEWQYAWTVNGVLTSQGVFTVGGPWYVTLAQLKKAINKGPTDTTPDDLLAPALTAASRSVELYCDERPPGGFLLANTATARLFRRDRWTLATTAGYLLPIDDVGAMDNFLVETSTDGGVTWVATTAYETMPDNALVKGLAINGLLNTATLGWPTWPLVGSDWDPKIRVTARWGWPSVPPSVRQATLLQASRLYRRKDSPEGVAGGGDWGLIRVPNLDPDVKALLSSLRTDALVG